MTNYSILSLSPSFLPSIYWPQPPRARWFRSFALINLRLPTGDEMMKSWHLRADVVTLRRDTWAATLRRNSERSPPYFTGGQTPRWRQLIPPRPPWDGGGCVDLLSCLARDAAMSDLWLCCGNICISPSPPWASELHVAIAINFRSTCYIFAPKHKMFIGKTCEAIRNQVQMLCNCLPAIFGSFYQELGAKRTSCLPECCHAAKPVVQSSVKVLLL